MTFKEALDYCKANKGAVARRLCWNSSNMKASEGIFWHAREEAFCYYYFIDTSRIVPLPRGWDDNPRVGTVVGMVELSDALADDWIIVDVNETRTPNTQQSEFENNDHFVGGLIDGNDGGYFDKRSLFRDFDFTL